MVLPTAPTPDDVMRVVMDVCRQYAFLVDTGGLSVLLYRDDGGPRRESFAQKLFYGIAFAYCRANDLDVSPEADAGRGRVDFKFSHGAWAKVVVETKLTSNPRLEHGFDVSGRGVRETQRDDSGGSGALARPKFELLKNSRQIRLLAVRYSSLRRGKTGVGFRRERVSWGTSPQPP